MLSNDYLVTVRYTPLRSFETVAGKFSTPGAPRTSVETFTALADEMVEIGADTLEAVGGGLDAISRSIFPKPNKRRRLVSQSNEALRGVLLDVGHIGERASRARDCCGAAAYCTVRRYPPAGLDLAADARTLENGGDRHVSLTDYEQHLANKVQFLLDAVLGLINTKQNNLHTVVSVVGIPPTLVASIYGMNFKNMPELTWMYGYQWGLGLIALSTILPILWFKWRGWL